MISPQKIECRVFGGPQRSAAQAWLNSRPNETGEGVEEKLAALDLPVNEFDRVDLLITAPILIREWFCSWRDHVVWARTSRADDLRRWGIYYRCLDAGLDYRAQFQRMLEAEGRGQDEFRLLLPTSYMTTWSANVSYRQLCRMISAARRDALAYKGSALLAMFALNDFSDRLFDACHEAFGRVEQIDHPGILREGIQHFEPVFAGDHAAICLKGVPLSLRAQLVRHRGLSIRDNLGELFYAFGSPTQDQNAKVDVSASGDNELWAKLVEKRNCWIAHTDLWAPVLAQFSSAPSGRPFLPCDKGGCPFKGDDDLRRAGKDPNPPCPKRARLDGLEVLQPLLARGYAATKAGAEGFWLNEIGGEG